MLKTWNEISVSPVEVTAALGMKRDHYKGVVVQLFEQEGQSLPGRAEGEAHSYQFLFDPYGMRSQGSEFLVWHSLTSGGNGWSRTETVSSWSRQLVELDTGLVIPKSAHSDMRNPMYMLSGLRYMRYQVGGSEQRKKADAQLEAARVVRVKDDFAKILSGTIIKGMVARVAGGES